MHKSLHNCRRATLTGVAFYFLLLNAIVFACAQGGTTYRLDYVGDVIGGATAAQGVGGADLQIMFEGCGSVCALFGDTSAMLANGQGPLWDRWRSNTMARLTGPGLAVEFMNGANEFLPRPEGCTTLTPTAGAQIGGALYAAYMCILANDGDDFESLYSGVAVSTDGGATWAMPEGARFDDAHLAQMAFVVEGGQLLALATEPGRTSGARLCRVDAGAVLDAAQWACSEGDVITGTVGELSVQWNACAGAWLALYKSPEHGALVLRESADLLRWGEAVILVALDGTHGEGRVNIGLYAPQIDPRDEGCEVDVAVSWYQGYRVEKWRLVIG